MSWTEDDIKAALKGVQDPDLKQDLVELGMIKAIKSEGANVELTVQLTTPACPLKDQIAGDVRAAVGGIDGVDRVEIEFSARVRGTAPPDHPQLKGVRNIISVGAGKGGVGKSTVATMVAMGLRRAGAAVGLLDADVYGPSLPTLLGLEGVQPRVEGQLLLPVETHGLKTMSVGFLVERDRPMVLRGPMLHGPSPAVPALLP